MANSTTPGLEGSATEGLECFIKSQPRMTMTVNGTPRFSVWVGIPQSRQDETGAWHEAEPRDAELAMFGPSAQKAFGKFRPGDHIVATGKVGEYPVKQDDGQTAMREYFHASHIGPDNNVTAFTVHRGPERYPAEREATQREAERQAGFEQAVQAQQGVAQQAPAHQTVTGPGVATQAPPAQAAPAQGAPAQSVPQPGAGVQAPPAQAMPVQQAAPASTDPVAEVLQQRQQQVAAEPHAPTAAPPGPGGIAR
ncbi:hypothetical protein VVR84_14175 [Kocuria carniphila]|uniref:Single-stranded DNA-binding protein n=1 Tax=Kocuria carniphila TaxID=262208 RepID=A0ABV3V4Y9_9MICC